MAQDNRERLKQLLASGEIRLQPLTFPQRELWEAAPLPAGDASNNICAMIHIGGPLTPEGSEAAFSKVVERQEAFRICFLPGKTGPLQAIRRSAKAVLPFHDLERHEDLDERAEEIFGKPFDLVRGPLYRAEVLRRGEEDFVLVFAIHHSIADGWTLGVFVQDLFAAYLQGVRGNHDPLPPVPQPYSEWGAAERAFWTPAELAKRAEWWRANLADAPRLWSPPSSPPDRPGMLERCDSLVPEDLARTIREVARRNGATLFSTLLAAFQITLGKWTGADDITVGTPVANRGRQAVRETMGYCSGVVPLRGKIEPGRSFSETIKAVHHATVDAFANAMPFAELAKAVGETAAPGYNPVYEVRFALQNHPVPDISAPGLSLQLRMRSTGTARFDLACEITEIAGELEVVWLFRDHLFPLAAVEDLGKLFLSVLTGACRSPDAITP